MNVNAVLEESNYLGWKTVQKDLGPNSGLILSRVKRGNESLGKNSL